MATYGCDRWKTPISSRGCDPVRKSSSTTSGFDLEILSDALICEPRLMMMSPVASTNEEPRVTLKPNQSAANVVTDERIASIRLAVTLRIPAQVRIATSSIFLDRNYIGSSSRTSGGFFNFWIVVEPNQANFQSLTPSSNIPDRSVGSSRDHIILL